MSRASETLSDLFRDLYDRVGALQAQLSSDPDAVSADEVRAALEPLIDRLGADRESELQVDPVSLEHARYLWVAFIDDHFGRTSWAGREAWQAETLESRLFRTDVAGREVYRRIRDLVESGDPGRVELGKAYLLALILGFQGSLPEASAQRTRRKLKLALASWVTGDGAPASAAETEAPWISPAAYRHTAGSGAFRRLPNLRRWGWLTAVLLLLLLVGSYSWWSAAVRPVSAVVEGALAPRTSTR